MFKSCGEFCAQCGTILPIAKHAPATVMCSLCKTEWLIPALSGHQIDKQERSYGRTVADSEISSLTTQDEVIQVAHQCQKCGYELASYTTQQTRSADEGQTVFYTCLKCKHKCIEYS